MWKEERKRKGREGIKRRGFAMRKCERSGSKGQFGGECGGGGGVGGDHPYHMFYGVLQRGRWWAEHT